MAVTEITSETQLENTLQTNAKVAAHFVTSWSAPCRTISPVFEKLSEQYKDVVCVKLDIDNVPAVAHQYSVSTTPTFIMLRNGEKSDDLIGANPVALEDKIKALAEA
ncbi:thioredoxin family protein [Nocardia amikacinitolerans]|uniref:thioredoxin family protein n=1 Tax=Nocardia amikacinitolerans TaxID=756689 RepID=UPI0020A2CFBA|nr:thioredoxin family protein [Nocardia amikacinitolerans]MCP2276180.1 thioredoxin [Nocardia amikacinitolerans]